MNESNRRFSRTDRPGSGVYRGESHPGIAFDDYRASDEQELHQRHDRPGPWRSVLNYLQANLFPLADDQVVKRAKNSLARDPTLDTSQLAVSADSGTLTISGIVPSRWMKERISDRLLDVNGVNQLRNHLKVQPEQSSLPQDGSVAD